jgi:hypothetical protein
MNWTGWLWLAAGLAGIVALIGFSLAWVRRSSALPTPAVRSALLVAAIMCAVSAYFIGGRMLELGDAVTAVDIAALAVVSTLTGCFLTLAVGLPTRKKNDRD